MIAWFIGAALALPPALLGADGPMWVGTVPPDAGLPVVAVVDPQSGALIVESTGRDGRLLRWDGSVWTLDGAALDPETPAAGHRVNGGQLMASETLLGSGTQYDYDEEGRLVGFRWGNGEQLTVRYESDGRVAEMIGPGTRRMQLGWTNGLRWTDALGRTVQRTQTDTGPVRTVTVSDALGRQVITRYRKRDDGWALTGWTDPRGLETRVGRYGDRMDVTAPGGRVYRMEVDEASNVHAVVMPGGQRWRWERDEAGVVQRMVDPAGRVTRFERDGSGRIVSVSPSGRVKRVQRGASGAIVGLVSATGAATQFIRDDQQDVRTIVDAAGNQLFIERFPNGWPSAVLERTGTRWNFSVDALGLPDRIEDPMGRIVRIDRNGAGWIERIVDSERGETKLEYTASGRIQAVVSPEGRRTEFERDATGWVTQIVRPDNTRLTLDRNPVGEVISVGLGAQQTDVIRAPDGRVRSVGSQRWTRDINGRVLAVEGRMGRWELARDPAGWIRKIQAGDWTVDIERDANGWPVRWSGTDGTVEVQRDASGRIVKESGPFERRVLRDPRGLPVRVVAGALGEWRTQRDATGRALTVRGPEGVNLSVERDLLGRPKWTRFPDGTILRRSMEGLVVDDVMVGPSGTVTGRQQTTFDSDGRPVSETVAGGDVWVSEYDPLGRLLTRTALPGAMWVWDEDRVLDPGGRLLLSDDSGRLMEAQLPPGPPAWDVSASMLSVLRDLSGHISGLSGDAGVAPVRFDALGRLEGFRPADSSGWSMRYDARGRPAAITAPDATVSQLVWHPDARASDGVAGILANGNQGMVPWVVMDGGMAARRNGMDTEGIVTNAVGTPAWLLDGTGGSTTLVHSPMGLPAQRAAGSMGMASRLQWFAGGPIQSGPMALDPVSGQRVDGVLGWPWTVAAPGAVVGSHGADPGPWAPVGEWTEPLRLLTDLGVIEPVVPENWTRVGPSPAALEGLPASMDGAPPPLGPEREMVPLETDDPITAWLIQCLLPGGAAPDTDGFVAALVASEVRLPWVPPDVTIPGLERWRSAGFFDVE
ncbi:MAG: hypothetical protein VX944_09995 [Myxococcota bacterium]|nr:hypothetical protein [Myxococcota bacterium]MEC9390393.1 hypothetical protein [Myxococcota bacterium]